MRNAPTGAHGERAPTPGPSLCGPAPPIEAQREHEREIDAEVLTMVRIFGRLTFRQVLPLQAGVDASPDEINDSIARLIRSGSILRSRWRGEIVYLPAPTRREDAEGGAS